MLSPAALLRVHASLRPRAAAAALLSARFKTTTTAAGTSSEPVPTPEPYREYIQPDTSARFPAERGRYHLYVAYSCPFASRTLVARNLKGLEDVISVSVAHPIFQKTKPGDESDAHLGWTFVDPATTPTVLGINGKAYATAGATPDAVNHVKFARDLYELVDPTPRKFSVPILWDKKTRTIVSNESADIVRTFNTGFRELVPESNAIDLLPPAIEEEVEAANNGIVVEISQPYFKAAFAKSAQQTQEGLANVFPAVAKLEKLLAAHRFVVGGSDDVTEADIRLFHLLIRVDVAQLATDEQPTLNDFPNVVGVRLLCRLS
jgi:putative glutathione S-transferase